MGSRPIGDEWSQAGKTSIRSFFRWSRGVSAKAECPMPCSYPQPRDNNATHRRRQQGSPPAPRYAREPPQSTRGAPWRSSEASRTQSRAASATLDPARRSAHTAPSRKRPWLARRGSPVVPPAHRLADQAQPLAAYGGRSACADGLPWHRRAVHQPALSYCLMHVAECRAGM